MTYSRPTAAEPASSIRDAAGGIVALTLATFAAITTEMLPVGLLPQIGDAFDVSDSTVGLLVTVYAFMVAALALPLTLGTRHLPRKGLLLTTLVAYTVSNGVVAVAPAFGVVAGARALGGVAHALFFSLSIGYAARLVRPHLTGRAMALVTAGASAGFVLGVPLSTTLGTAVGWRLAFAVLAGVCLVTTVLVAAFLPPVASENEHTHPVAGRRPQLAAAVTTNAVVYLGQYVVYTYVAVLLLHAGVAEGAVGAVLLGVGAVGLLGLWFSAARLDVAPRQSAVLVLAVLAASLVALALAYPSRGGVLGATAVWGASFGAIASIFQTAAVRARGASPDVAGALVNATANVGIGGGAALGALVLHVGSLGVLPWLGAGLVAAGLVIVLVARRTFPSA
ncbi:MFS transporter [Luteimicrobium album]|uniref:MFS transporter n=1 Tax=Luteimicrobium album TaxID=1054550 RepID=A0ABQ6I202_9MICO|nr:MFS transporter [Luteimicrobium album]GMA23963.1 MFS transporter [Luteimicrobium album]